MRCNQVALAMLAIALVLTGGTLFAEKPENGRILMVTQSGIVGITRNRVLMVTQSSIVGVIAVVIVKHPLLRRCWNE